MSPFWKVVEPLGDGASLEEVVSSLEVLYFGSTS